MQQPRSQATPLMPLEAPYCASRPSVNEGVEASLGWDLPPTAATERHDESNAPSTQPTLLGNDASLPVFTSREEEIEFATQPAEEIVAAEADVLGMTEHMARVDVGDNISDAYFQLEAELALMPVTEKAAYIEAIQRCPQQVDDEHKKAFLWREEFNAKLAAKRLVKYWEQRHAMFGEEKCYLPLAIKGSLRDDIVALQHCMLRVLPEKDMNGRTMILWQWDSYADTSICSKESMLRACWYTFHVASQDPTDRQRGFVILFRPFSSQSPNMSNAELLWFHSKLAKDVFAMELDILPIVFRGLHWCKPNSRFHLVAPFAKYMMGKRLRTRFKVHYGSDEEVLKSLEEYGMLRSHLPTELGGNVVICQDHWLRDRLAVECCDNAISAAAALQQSVVSSSTPDFIGENNPSFQQISEETKLTPMIDNRHVSLISDDESDQGDSRLGKIESVSTVKRELDRKAHLIGDVQYKHAKRTSITKSSAAQGSSNEKPDSDDVASIDDATKRKVAGRKGDSRMNRAVKAKLENPSLTAEDALCAGGFIFPKKVGPFMTDRNVLDTDNVSVEQRKHQLRRRLRNEEKKSEVR